LITGVSPTLQASATSSAATLTGRSLVRVETSARWVGVQEPGPGVHLQQLGQVHPRQEHAASLLRGAGYTVFDGAPPLQRLHAGIGAPYAHVTAPLRRLVDRYAN
jgi:hypothetical protein